MTATETRPAQANGNGRQPVRASAQRIQTGDAKVARSTVGKGEAWQAEATEYFDDVGMVKQVVYFRANQMAKLRIFPAVRPLDDPEAAPVPVTDPNSGVPADLAARAQAEVERIKGASGGTAEILRLLDMNNEVVGECWIVGRGPTTRTEYDAATQQDVEVLTLESWEVRSILEVQKKGEGAAAHWEVQNAETGGWDRLDLDNRDVLVRVWQRHPFYAGRADCHMRGILTDCEALVLLTNEVKAESKSRQNNGVLFVPNSMTISQPTQSSPASQSDDPDAVDEPPDVEDEAPIATIASALGESMLEPIGDPSSPWSVEPRIITGPAEDGQHIRYISLNREASDRLEERIAARKEAIAQGLNVPIEVAKGHQETTFANAAQIDEDIWEKHLQPTATLICDMWTIGLLRPALADSGAPSDMVDRIIVWFDPTDILEQADPAEHVKEALELKIIGGAAGRRYWGYSEDDAPEEGEFPSAPAMPFGTPPATDNTDIVDGEDAQPMPMAASAKPSLREQGKRLADGDRLLMAKTVPMLHAAMTRALERAGNRLKAQTVHTALGAVLRPVHPMYAAQQIGPGQLATFDVDTTTLVDDDAFDREVTQFHTWAKHWQQTALGIAAGMAGLSAKQRRTLAEKQAQHLSDASEWMNGQLHDLAQERMFRPDPQAPAHGEFDPSSRVPMGLVRTAVAIAGGAIGLEFAGGATKSADMAPADQFVPLLNDQPPGGIGTGPLLTEAITSADTIVIEGWQWDYGDAYRQNPYEPHVDLDGVVAESKLDFGEDDFGPAFPGNHPGCACGDLIPVYAEVPQGEGPAPIEADLFGGE